MVRLFLTLFLGFNILIVNGKEYHFRGQVLDSISQKPIAYATLLIKNTIYGTQADEYGKFSFQIPDGYDNDTISVSVLSYKEQDFTMKEMDKMNIIYLKPLEQLLDEVVVYPMKGEDILRKAVENRKKNHNAEHSQKQEAFFRELYFESGEPLRVGEGVVTNYHLKKDRKWIDTLVIHKSRSIQDSAKLWLINDIFRMKKDTLSLNIFMASAFTPLDMTEFIEVIYLDAQKKKGKDISREKKKERKKGMEITVDFALDIKYAGIINDEGRSTYRLPLKLQNKEKAILTGQVLIDSATYAFRGIQLSNQKVDIFKEIVPWYMKAVIRILGYKLEVKDLMISTIYQPTDSIWHKSYSIMKYGAKVTKKRRPVEGYLQSEYFYKTPQLSADSMPKVKKFKEVFVSSFDEKDFWKPYTGVKTPLKIKKYVQKIQQSNQKFEGSIGYNKKESRAYKKTRNSR